MDQVLAGSVLGRLVRASSWVQGNVFILGALTGLMKGVANRFPYFILEGANET